MSYEKILEKLKKEDEVIGNLMKIHFHRFSESEFVKVGLLKVYPLINKIILNLKKDLIIVTPSKKEIAYLSSIFATLNIFKNNFEDRVKNFTNWLKEGSNVMLCSSGKETGKIYKYLGKSNDNKYVRLGSLRDPTVKIEHRVKTILQLCPTPDSKPQGKTGNIIPPELTPIDELINIKSYGNPILYQNKMIVLTNTFKAYKDFLNKETLLSKKNQLHDKFLNDIIKNGQIDEDGSIKDESIEPLLLYTRDLNSLYQYSSKAENDKIVICDDIKKLDSDFSIVNQIKNNGDKFRFLVFAEENEFDQIKSYHNKSGCDVWRFSKNEIKSHIENVQHDEFDLNSIASGRAFIKNRIYCEKKRIPINCEENIFNKIHYQFQNIFKLQQSKSEDIQEITKDMLFPLHIKMYVLRDHIFGFPEELILDFEQNMQSFDTEMNSRQTYLDSEMWDHLIKLKNLFAEVPKNGEGIFDERLEELKKNLELRESDSKNNYAVLVYKIKTKNYFKKNIKEKWNIDTDVIYSINTPRTFKNLIVPSELPRSKIETLLLNNNFENIFLMGAKSINEEMNKTYDALSSRWQSFYLNGEKKCEITGIDKNLANAFPPPEVMRSSTTASHVTDIIDLEKFFHDDKSSFFNKDTSSENEKTVLAWPVVFNGDAYAYFTENFKIEILNYVFDPSAFEKRSDKITMKDWNNLNREDIIMVRHSVDRDVLDRESILILGDKEKYISIRKKIDQIPKTLNNVFGENIRKRDIKGIFMKVGYSLGLNNIISLANPNEGTNCPREFNNLEKIFKACEIKDSKKFTYNKKECKEIFDNAKIFNKIRIKAGRQLSQKLRNAVRKKDDFDYDGNPLRVDYIDGELVLGSDESENPEAWIVQINNYKEPRALKEVKASLTNRIFV